MKSSAIKLFLNCRNTDDRRLLTVAIDYAVGSRFAQVIEVRIIPKAAHQAAFGGAPVALH